MTKKKVCCYIMWKNPSNKDVFASSWKLTLWKESTGMSIRKIRITVYELGLAGAPCQSIAISEAPLNYYVWIESRIYGPNYYQCKSSFNVVLIKHLLWKTTLAIKTWRSHGTWASMLHPVELTEPLVWQYSSYPQDFY